MIKSCLKRAALMLAIAISYSGAALAADMSPECSTLAQHIDSFPENTQTGTTPFIGRAIDQWSGQELTRIYEKFSECDQKAGRFGSDRAKKMFYIANVLGNTLLDSPCFSDLCVGQHPDRIKQWAPADLRKAHETLRDKSLAAYYVKEYREAYKGPARAVQDIIPYMIAGKFDNKFIKELGIIPEAEFCQSQNYHGTYTSAGGNPTYVTVVPIGMVQNNQYISSLTVESVKRCFPGANADDVQQAITRLYPKFKGRNRIDGITLDSRDPECGNSPSVMLGDGGVRWNSSWLFEQKKLLKNVPMCKKSLRID
jgi:hypothetical protein